MSTPFDVRSWANQAGIQMSGGFAVVAECVTLDELQAFAQIAIGEYVKSQLHPPQRKPLTDEEIEQAYRNIWRNIPADFDHTSMGWIEQGIRYAEQAHSIGEKK